MGTLEIWPTTMGHKSLGAIEGHAKKTLQEILSFQVNLDPEYGLAKKFVSPLENSSPISTFPLRHNIVMLGEQTLSPKCSHVGFWGFVETPGNLSKRTNYPHSAVLTCFKCTHFFMAPTKLSFNLRSGSKEVRFGYPSSQ